MAVIWQGPAGAGNDAGAALDSSGAASNIFLFVRVYVPPPGPRARNPSNLIDFWNCFHRVETETTDAGPPAVTQIRYRRADWSAPPFAVQVLATPGTEDDYARIFIDPRIERVYVIYQAGPDDDCNVMEVYSDDDGETWSDPDLAIAGGSRPACLVGGDGTIYRLAVVGTEIHFTRQHPGDVAPSAINIALDDAEVNLAVEQDTIGLAESKDTPTALVMSIIVLGETEVSDWASWDDLTTSKRLT